MTDMKLPEPPKRPEDGAEPGIWADYHTKMARYLLALADQHTLQAKTLKLESIELKGKIS